MSQFKYTIKLIRYFYTRNSDWIPIAENMDIQIRSCHKKYIYYQMMLGQSSQRIPSVIADKIRSHQEVQGHHQLVLPDQRKDLINIKL
jgi:hypothetical protein